MRFGNQGYRGSAPGSFVPRESKIPPPCFWWCTDGMEQGSAVPSPEHRKTGPTPTKGNKSTTRASSPYPSSLQHPAHTKFTFPFSFTASRRSSSPIPLQHSKNSWAGLQVAPPRDPGVSAQPCWGILRYLVQVFHPRAAPAARNG